MTKSKKTVVKKAVRREVSKKKPAKLSPFGASIVRGLMEAVAFERGELPNVKVKTVTARYATAEAPPGYPPERIKALRAKAGLSQPVFARALNVDPDTVRAWEQGKRTPSGAALRLLEITELHPEWVEGFIQAR